MNNVKILAEYCAEAGMTWEEAMDHFYGTYAASAAKSSGCPTVNSMMSAAREVGFCGGQGYTGEVFEG